MSRHLSPQTKQDNFNTVLWRSSQLYVCSFAYTFMSLISGTKTAFKARFLDCDNTMWSSFRVNNGDLITKRQQIGKHSFGTTEYREAVYSYLRLYFISCYASLFMPDVLTKYFAGSLFILQIVAMVTSVAVINANNSYFLLISIIVCGLNTFLVMDIALLLVPQIVALVGRPIRPEYGFAMLSAVIVITLIVNNQTPDIPFGYLVSFSY